MTKFAFKDETERSAFWAIAASTPGLPQRLEDSFSAFVAANSVVAEWTKTAAGGKNESSVLRQQHLDQLLQSFLQQNGLAQHKEIQEYMKGVVKTMGAYLQQYGPAKDPFDQLRERYPVDPSLDDPSTVDRPAPEVPGGRQNQMQQPVFTRSDEAFYGKNPMDLLNEPDQASPQVKKVTPPTKPVYTRRPMGASTHGLQRNAAMQNYDDFLASLLKLADEADEAGMTAQADKIATVLPLCKTIKVAQYEGFQNYWIANGRAFEMAWKAKRSKGKGNKRGEEDFKSAHECWFEVLEEYQKSLLTNQQEFISKYAARGADDVSASQILLDRISEKVAAGASPGVAFYESIDEMSKGKHNEMVMKAVSAAVLEVKKQAEESGNAKIAAQADEIIKTAEGLLSNLWQGVRNVGDFFRGTRVPSTVDLAKDILENRTKVIRGLERIRAHVQGRGDAFQGQPQTDQRIKMQDIYTILHPVYQNVQEYVARQKLLGMHAPNLINIEDLGSLLGGGRTGVVNLEKLEEFTEAIEGALEYVSMPAAKQIDGYLKKQYPQGLSKPATSMLAEADGQQAPDAAPQAAPGAPAPAGAEPPASGSPAAPPPPETKAPPLSDEAVMDYVKQRVEKDKVSAGILVRNLAVMLNRFLNQKTFMDDPEIKSAIDEIRKKEGTGKPLMAPPSPAGTGTTQPATTEGPRNEEPKPEVKPMGNGQGPA